MTAARLRRRLSRLHAAAWACGIVVVGGSYWAGAAIAPRAVARAPLRICADPNDLPFSNDRLAGFENQLAAMAARELDRPLAYDWHAQRRGFVRETLDAGTCDVLMGVPARLGRVLTTRAYYRSSYVFVTRRGIAPGLSSLDDPRLRRLRVGVQLIGDDFQNTPPAHALSRRGIVRNVVGFTVYGDYRRESPSAEIVHAVARGDVDTALVWGPLAGYFAAREPVPLDVVPIAGSADATFPFVFDIAMAVRRGDVALRDRLDDFLVRHAQAVGDLLARYGVPQVD